MKEEYDFSKGERGKFYHPDAEFDIPVYLEPDIAEYIKAIASKKNTDINEIVNDWLRKNIALIQSANEKSGPPLHSDDIT
ncbi:hypothetical protein [Desulfonema magnum]|uniref:CopG family transcriptional regulator n=1 Tax=Desulfonema magnum TaxID=45655 RepID=A0A975BGJ6_9BACT|nr:hypothetical protein [Desulfonema magnum]QTA84981.1 Uncharacterized protein dnm_009850 [Desulfonema magnum]